MAKKNEAPSGKSKNSMIKVLCPKAGNVPTWANVGAKNGARCTKCGATGHDLAPKTA